MRVKKKFIISLALILVGLVYAMYINRPTAKALRKFYYGRNACECTIIDPLILAGEKVVPYVIQDVSREDLPRRRYAIGFLGNGRYKQALPVLQEILENNEEDELFRGDALLAIYEIDQVMGNTYVKKHRDRRDFLGSTARDIERQGTKLLEYSRTYSKALIGEP